jgi:hypothetical protein
MDVFDWLELFWRINSPYYDIAVEGLNYYETIGKN